MPSPGVVNNPTGSNAYGTNQGEEPYGAIERRKVLTRMAPLPPNKALNAPDRAQNRATSTVKRREAPPPKPIQTTAADQATVDEAASRAQPEQAADPVAEFWRSLASEPGASQLVRSYAAQAAQGA